MSLTAAASVFVVFLLCKQGTVHLNQEAVSTFYYLKRFDMTFLKM